jgi:hypothetical protein
MSFELVFSFKSGYLNARIFYGLFEITELDLRRLEHGFRFEYSSIKNVVYYLT